MGNYQYKDRYHKNPLEIPSRKIDGNYGLWRSDDKSSISNSVYNGENWNNLECSGLHMDKIRSEGNEICYWESE